MVGRTTRENYGELHRCSVYHVDTKSDTLGFIFLPNSLSFEGEHRVYSWSSVDDNGPERSRCGQHKLDRKEAFLGSSENPDRPLLDIMFSLPHTRAPEFPAMRGVFQRPRCYLKTLRSFYGWLPFSARVIRTDFFSAHRILGETSLRVACT